MKSCAFSIVWPISTDATVGQI